MSQLVTAGLDAIDLGHLRRELKRLTIENELLREKLRLARILKYGPSSEKLNDAQLLLLEGEPGVSQDEVLAESTREAMPSEMPVEKPRSAGKHPGRQSLPAQQLPRIRRLRLY
ncbi:hypothetical protein [Bryobacter aggregatus]|uniref:IS66 family transposase n=1 Tax=Bryobacter aggregatus TaxID=360054 RepID=UPI0004E11092|nr:hypothetical protein [Bryobacter aggregatus]